MDHKLFLFEKNYGQIVLLYILKKGKNDVAIQELAEKIGMNRQYCYEIIRQMEEQGVLTTTRPKRMKYVTLTEQGLYWAEKLYEWYYASKHPYMPRVDQ